MEVNKSLIAFASFVLGLLAASLFFMSGVGISGFVVSEPSKNLESIPSPSDIVKDSDIDLFTNKLIIDIPGLSVVSYKDSQSMLPLLTNSSHGIRVKPQSQFDIQLGDIISFNMSNMTVVHRVIDVKSDEKGLYFVTQGDNSAVTDKNKIRFDDVEWKLIGVLY